MSYTIAQRMALLAVHDACNTPCNSYLQKNFHAFEPINTGVRCIFDSLPKKYNLTNTHNGNSLQTMKATQPSNGANQMKVYPTMEPIEVINNDIYIDGKLIESFDKVELTECNGQAYLGCFVWSEKHQVMLSEDCFKVEL